MTAVTPRSDQLPTGIEGLDIILRGGLLRGAGYIIQGPPGAGKTILSNQICFNHTASGGIALYVTLLAESHDRMLGFLQSMEFYNSQIVPQNLVYISAYATLQKEGLAGLIRLLLKETRKRNASLVVFDGLFVAQDVAKDDYSFRTFVHELQGIAAITGATMLMLTNQMREPSSPEFTMVDGWLELYNETQELRAVRMIEVHKQRGGAFIRGRHLFRISDAGISIFPRVEAAFSQLTHDNDSEEKIRSGLPVLDAMLKGGYPECSATLFYGPTGSGKTTFGLHFIGQSTPAEPGLVYGFFETPKRLMVKAHSIGIDLSSMVEQKAVEIFWRSPSENLIDEVCYEIIGAVERTGAKHVFIDGLSAIKKSLINPARLPLIINALNHRLRQLGASVVYTMEHRELFLPNDLLVDDLSSFADNIVLLHYALRDNVLRRHASILKVRDSDFDAVSREFGITSFGIVFKEGDSVSGPEGRIGTTMAEKSVQEEENRRTDRKAE